VIGPGNLPARSCSAPLEGTSQLSHRTAHRYQTSRRRADPFWAERRTLFGCLPVIYGAREAARAKTVRGWSLQAE